MSGLAGFNRTDGPRASGLILAGGRSRRMGQDKAQLEIGGKSLLGRSVEVLSQVVDDVFVVGLRAQMGLDPSIRLVPDDVPGAGPLGGLTSGLRCSRHPYAAVVACDLPFLDADFLRYMLELAPGHDAVVPVAEGRRQPLHAVYACRVRAAAERQVAAGVYEVDRLLSGLEVRWIGEDEIEARGLSRRSLMNVNTPEEWEAALQIRS